MSNNKLECCTKLKKFQHLLVNATICHDANYNIMCAEGVVHDVTETSKHDCAVAAMANLLHQLVDKANTPILGIDVDGIVNEWNEKSTLSCG
eukprot:15347461-Ditylum_brightwellii.AAC.1